MSTNIHRVLLDPDVKDTTGGGASTSTTQAGAGTAVKEPTLEDVVQQAFAASVAAGPDGLQGGGRDPEGKPASDVPKQDTTEPKEEGDDKEPSDDDAKKEDGVEDEEKVEDDGTKKADKKADEEEVVPDPEDAKDPEKNDKHPRIQELVAERNTYKAELDEAKPLVEAQKNTVQFCQQYGITAEDYNDTLTTLALVRSGDLQQAAERLKPLLEVLKPYLGGEDSLDHDLAKDVEASFITVERAKEMQKLRLQTKAQGVRQTMSAAQAQREQLMSRNRSITDWDMATRKKDTSFKPRTAATEPGGKYEYVSAQFQNWLNSNPMATAPQAIAQVEALKADADRMFSRVAVAKPLTRKIPRSNGSSTNMPAEPTSIHQIVSGVLNGTLKSR